MFDQLPIIPIEQWSESIINWMNQNCDIIFDFIAWIINGMLNPIERILISLPAIVIILVVTILSYFLGRLKLSAFVLFALLFIGMIGYWPQTMQTLALVLTATFLSLIIGIPFGILKAYNKTASYILNPLLDFMQTMPLFVYLIPAVLFFSIGNVPGIVATFIFATPPAVRLTSLGIEQVPEELKEAGHAFGASKSQLLTKIEIPLAMPSIMMGVNQSIMLSLSMVVVASMIGAEGLGQEVLRGIMRLKVGQGIASGLGIVLLAMVLDRITKTVWKK